MKRKVWIGFGIALVIILLVSINLYRTMAKENVTVKVENITKEEISANVMTPGTLKLSQDKSIYFNPEKGDIKEILVEKGDKVKKGTVLIRYTNEMLDLEKEQNALQIDSYYIRLNNFEKQEKRLEEKEKELKKQVGKIEAEKTLEPEYEQLQMEKRMTNIELKQALLQKDVIEKKMKALEIKSTMDGTVLGLNQPNMLEQQELATKPIIRLGNMEKFIVEGVISEYDTLKVKKGQNVKLRSDVLPEEEWNGKVLEVSYLPKEQMQGLEGNQTAVQYPIMVSVENKNIGLKPGFQIIMDIETDKHTAITVPLNAIKQIDNQQFVYVVEDGHAVQREIEVGVATNEKIEIISGIKENEKVILNPPDSLKEGMEVTVE